jgi:hypothetical protein
MKQKSRVEYCNRDRDSNCCHRNFSLALVRRSLPQGSPHVSKSYKVSTICAVISGTGTRRQCPNGANADIRDALDPPGPAIAWCRAANQKMPRGQRSPSSHNHKSSIGKVKPTKLGNPKLSQSPVRSPKAAP